MRAKRMFMATMAAMFVMTGAFQTGSFASNGNGGARLVAKLAPAQPVEDFKGRVVQRVQGKRTVFKAQVEVPLNVLGVKREDADDVILKLTVPGMIDCTMAFDEVDEIEDVAEYKVVVRQRNTDQLTTIKAGSCSISDISLIRQYHEVSVTIQGASTPLLTGTFSLK